MSANAALKEKAYTADSVTAAGIALIRARKTGLLAKAFGRPETARRKVAEKLKYLGHQYDIDAMCLEALERYVEEHGDVPNATKVIASAQILDRLPDPQFDSGHRIVFAINEDGTDFIGASEMGLAIAPGGTTTTSRKGKMDERFGAITKQTLWITIDFPEKTELDAIELEQAQAFDSVAEAIADPAAAAANFDEVIAQIQALGDIADIDVATTIKTVANVIEAHAIATEAHKIVEAGVITPDSPQITGMTARVETLTQQVATQLAAPDVPVPPVITEMMRAVMETAAPPQAQAQVHAQPAAPDIAAPLIEATHAVVTTTADTPTIQSADHAARQNSMESTVSVDALAVTEHAVSTPQTMAVETIAAMEPDRPTQEKVPAATTSEATVISPQAFEQTPPPAALAAQIVALSAHIPPAQQTPLSNTVIKQVATAIKNEQPVNALLQKKIETVIAAMPSGPAKQELARVVETVQTLQQARSAAPARITPTHLAQKQPALETINRVAVKQAFVGSNPVAPSPIPSPRNDNAPMPATPARENHGVDSGTPMRAATVATLINTAPTDTGNRPHMPVPPPQPAHTGEHAADAPHAPIPATGERSVTSSSSSAHSLEPDERPASPPAPLRHMADNDHAPRHSSDGSGGGYEPPDTSGFKAPDPAKESIASPSQPPEDISFETTQNCGVCPRKSICPGFCGAASITSEEKARQQNEIVAVMEDYAMKYAHG